MAKDYERRQKKNLWKSLKTMKHLGSITENTKDLREKGHDADDYTIDPMTIRSHPTNASGELGAL